MQVVRPDGPEPARLAASLACGSTRPFSGLPVAQVPSTPRQKGRACAHTSTHTPTFPHTHTSPHIPIPTHMLAHTCAVPVAHADLPLLPGASLGWEVRLQFLKLLLFQQTKLPLASSL